MFWNSVTDRRIANLDPLCADGVMKEVPQYNRNGDVKQLASLLRDFCKRANIESRNYQEIGAIVRDIGIVAGSIQRHDYSPTALVPELEPIFLKAAEMTDLPARDTLMHYTIWNPEGSRLRTYTDHAQEPDLIKSMRISLPAIREATRRLVHLRALDLKSRQATHIADTIGQYLKIFLSGLNHAKHNVAPDVFIASFRPFFEPFAVGNSVLRGPGAVTMPLHIFDFLLWGCSEPDQPYQLFTADYIPFNMSEFRQYYLQARNTPSFLDRLETEVCSTADVNPIRSLLFAVETWFKRLRGFRGSHLKYANKAYHGTTPHSFKSGSGGHTTSDIELIATLTEKHGTRFDALLEHVSRLNLEVDSPTKPLPKPVFRLVS